MTDRSNLGGVAGLCEIVPNRLFSIGASISTDNGSSWIPAEAKPWMPAQCYALVSGSALVMIDAGFAIHRDLILDAVSSLAKGREDRAFLMTRKEPDTIINLPDVVHLLNLKRVWCGRGISPLDFFEIMDESSSSSYIEKTSGVRLKYMSEGDVIEFADFRFKVIQQNLRILPTSWFYEYSTRALFCSDFWNFVSFDSVSPVLTDRAADVAEESIYSHLSARLEWLRGIDVEPFVEELTSLMDQLEPAFICPTLGGAIVGKPAIDALISNTKNALRKIGSEPRRSKMEAFLHENASNHTAPVSSARFIEIHR